MGFLSGILGGGTKKVKPTEEERTAAEIGAKEWNRLVTQFTPVEDSFLKMTNAGTAGDRSLRRANVSAMAAKGAGKPDAGIIDMAGAGGVAPSAGRVARAIGAESRAMARGLGSGLTGVEQAMNDRERSGMQKAIAFRRGLADNSSVSLGRAGYRDTMQGIENADQDYNTMQTLYSAAATLGGAGYNQFKNSDFGSTLMGTKYGTNPFSEQSRMLAAEEWAFRK